MGHQQADKQQVRNAAIYLNIWLSSVLNGQIIWVLYPCMVGPGLKAAWYATEVLGKLVGMGKTSAEVSEASPSMLSEVRMALSNHLVSIGDDSLLS